MMTHVLQLNALVKPDSEAAVEEVLRRRTQDNLGLGAFAGNGVGRRQKRVFTREENVEEDAQRPDLGRKHGVRAAAEDLRRGVGAGAVEALCNGAQVSCLSQWVGSTKRRTLILDRRWTSRIENHDGAEVDELDPQALVDADVLVLPIPVQDAHLRKVAGRVNELVENVTRNALAEMPLPLDPVEEVRRGAAHHRRWRRVCRRERGGGGKERSRSAGESRKSRRRES